MLGVTRGCYEERRGMRANPDMTVSFFSCIFFMSLLPEASLVDGMKMTCSCGWKTQNDTKV